MLREAMKNRMLDRPPDYKEETPKPKMRKPFRKKTAPKKEGKK